jgi:hypothetical protein
VKDVVKDPVTVVPVQLLFASLTLKVMPVVEPPYVQVIFAVVPVPVTVGVPGVYRGVMLLDVTTFDAVPFVDRTVKV